MVLTANLTARCPPMEESSLVHNEKNVANSMNHEKPLGHRCMVHLGVPDVSSTDKVGERTRLSTQMIPSSSPRASSMDNRFSW